jgi:hypothetical protein
MGLRNRNGKWHYRFYAAGQEWSGDTGLVATEGNRSVAMMVEAEARKLVKDGRGDHLKLTIKPFSDAADQFIEWAKGEYRTKPEYLETATEQHDEPEKLFSHPAAALDRGAGAGLYELAPHGRRSPRDRAR